MKRNLEGKNFLITAGSTWVPIDRVRVITNVFGGRLGILISYYARKKGANVTLLLGPGNICASDQLLKGIKIIRFKYFSDLLSLVIKELRTNNYDVMIHSAAVSDYIPEKISPGKIKSNKNKLTLVLKPTIKIVDLVKKIKSSIFLVKFKLEVNISEKKLLQSACDSMVKSNADLIVANDFNDMKKKQIAYVINKDFSFKKVLGKENIAKSLIHSLIAVLK